MANAKLRLLRIEDVDNMMSWVNDPDVVRNFQNFDTHMTREMEINYLEKMLKSRDDRMFAVESESGEYLGNAGIHQINSKNRLGRLALIIGNKKHWGEGYGQSAMKELLRYAFEEYGLNKVWLITFKENDKTRHIYKKVGFREEGLLVEEYADKEGKFHDMVRMAMLKREYLQLKQEGKI